MKILILGGDGFCGWPTSLYLSKRDNDIVIVDNLSRRTIDFELQYSSLTPISTIEIRLNAWKEITGRELRYYNFDVSVNYDQLLGLLVDYEPDAIIHFAEQSSAPYSMKGSSGKRYTVNNNLNATNNVLAAIVESGLDIHVVHLGTMGVYGYGGVDFEVPEGYLNVKIANNEGEEIEQNILYPPNPGSIYHMTKTQDALLFSFYNKNDCVRVTDLHQGVVWGTQTDETALDERLINRFNYDGDFGTVLNRFILQAAINHPLTVYGTGGQTRAFIHIKDTVKCIEIALNNPPSMGDKVKIFNQMTETHTVSELAHLISSMTGVKINYINNPRKEASENTLKVNNECLLSLGLIPTKLEKELLNEIRESAEKYSANCNRSQIMCTSYWTEENNPDIT